MAITPLKLTQHDLQPYYRAQAKDADGAAISLSGATIRCTMKLDGGTTPKIDRATTGMVITDEAAGKFEYRWQSGDTGTSGTYNIEFEISPASGGKFTLPSPDDSPAQVIISAGQDGE